MKTLRSIAKIALQSRCLVPAKIPADKAIVVLGNGPSLNTTIEQSLDVLRSLPCMAVNFAALADVLREIRPQYYVLADPHFFIEDGGEGSNLSRLRDAFKRIDWPMTLFVPARCVKAARRFYASANVSLRPFNAVGVEGWRPLVHAAFRLGLGMPRPRNVLIPAIMLAIGEGFGTVYVAGADHSWTATLSVTDENEVVSVQPHFYADSGHEEARVRHEYQGYRLHQIMESFTIAFRSYHEIAAWAQRRGVDIVNVTPGSFIDAFRRGRLPQK